MKKLMEAHRILETCIGTHGVWADPTRYRGQCWTRDFSLAIQPLLLQLGKSGVASRHLRSIHSRQGRDGSVPILFLDGASGTMSFLKDKVMKSVRDGRMSFMLRRFMSGNLHRVTPGTRDSELLYVTAACDHREATGQLPVPALSLERALEFIRMNLVDKDGLLLGCDWRDTMEKELGRTPLLTNNSMLFRAYTMTGHEHWAKALREVIEARFWDGGHLLDHPGSRRFDPLGASLAVLNGVVHPERYGEVLAGFRSVSTEWGVTIKCRHNPVSIEEAKVIDETDGVVVWPFIVGFALLAMKKMLKGHADGQESKAIRIMMREQWEALEKMEGFREWYDPRTGKGYGAGEQLWSATMYARAWEVIQDNDTNPGTGTGTGKRIGSG